MLFVALRYDKPPEHTVFTEKFLRVNIVPCVGDTAKPLSSGQFNVAYAVDFGARGVRGCTAVYDGPVQRAEKQNRVGKGRRQ